MKHSFLWRGVAWSPADRPDIRLLAKPAILMASVGGVGFVPKIPGTAGSVVGLALGLACSNLSMLSLTLLFACLIAGGTWAADRTGAILGKHDHSLIVCDETIAMALVVVCSPQNAVSFLAGFVLFRIFDVIKPWPANLVESRVVNGLGVMGDDLVAAAYAIAVIRIVQLLS